MGVYFSPSELSLDHLIAQAQADTADDTDAMDQILRRFEGSAQRIARSLSSEPHVQQDAAQGARLGLVRAVRAHRVGTAGFPSYARRFMHGAALRAVTSVITRDEISLDPQDAFWTRTLTSSARAGTSHDLLDLFGALSTEQQAVAVARYEADDHLADIAADLSISVSAVSQRLQTIHSILRPLLQRAMAA